MTIFSRVALLWTPVFAAMVYAQLLVPRKSIHNAAQQLQAPRSAVHDVVHIKLRLYAYSNIDELKN